MPWFFARNSYYRVIPHKVFVIDHDRLGKDFIEDELFVVLSYIKNSKSLWIDGQYCEFYCKSMWDIVEDGNTHLDLEAFSIGCLMYSINLGWINLILNNVSKYTIWGWWPINLLSVYYKITALRECHWGWGMFIRILCIKCGQVLFRRCLLLT